MSFWKLLIILHYYRYSISIDFYDGLVQTNTSGWNFLFYITNYNYFIYIFFIFTFANANKRPRRTIILLCNLVLFSACLIYTKRFSGRDTFFSVIGKPRQRTVKMRVKQTELHQKSWLIQQCPTNACLYFCLGFVVLWEVCAVSVMLGAQYLKHL